MWCLAFIDVCGQMCWQIIHWVCFNLGKCVAPWQSNEPLSPLIDVVSQEMVPKVLGNRTLIAEYVLCLGCICQHLHAHTGRDANNTVIGGNYRGFFGAAGEIAHFDQPLFSSVLTLFSSLTLSSWSITSPFFQKWNLYYFPFMGPVHLKMPMKGHRSKLFSSR